MTRKLRYSYGISTPINEADAHRLLHGLVAYKTIGSTFPVDSRLFHEGDVFARSMAHNCDATRTRGQVLT